MLPIENPEDVLSALRSECMRYEFYNGGKRNYEIFVSENLFAVLSRSDSLIGLDLRSGEKGIWGHPLYVMPNKPPLWFLLGEGKILHPPLRPW